MPDLKIRYSNENSSDMQRHTNSVKLRFQGFVEWIIRSPWVNQ